MDHLPKAGDKIVLALTIKEGSKIVTIDEETILAPATIPWGTTGLVKNEAPLASRKGLSLKDTIGVEFVALPAWTLIIHRLYIEPWTRCQDCECCPGTYQCEQRDGVICATHIHKTYCCRPLPAFQRYDGKFTLFAEGDRVMTTKRFASFTVIKASSGLDSPYRPPIGDLGIVAGQIYFEEAQRNGLEGIPIYFDDDPTRSAVMISPVMLKKDRDERIRIKDPQNRRLSNAIEWARAKWANLGLCWQCQANGKEGVLFPEVSDPTGEGKFFHVQILCNRGHYGRALAVEVDANEFG